MLCLQKKSIDKKKHTGGISCLAQPIGGQFVIGLSIERGQIVCGLLDMGPEKENPLGGLNIRQIYKKKHTLGSNGQHVYKKAALAIAEALASEKVRGLSIDGVGVGIPGVVDIRNGQLKCTPTELKPAEIPVEIAYELTRLSYRGVISHLGSRENQDADARVRNCIVVDNDVRCISRHILNSHPETSNFINVYLGKGVGSAIILNGEIYLGKHGFAGEYGHQIFGFGPGIDLLRNVNERRLETVKCACNRLGVHFETLVGDSGVLRIAKSLDPELFAVLQKEFGNIGNMESAGLLKCADDILSRKGRGRLPKKYEILCQRNDPKLHEFFGCLKSSYVQLLAMGITNAVSLLDLNQVYLCGPLAHLLKELPDFHSELTSSISNYLMMNSGIDIRWGHENFADVWIGAGLVFRDPSVAIVRSAVQKNSVIHRQHAKFEKVPEGVS
jgi:ROK family